MGTVQAVAYEIKDVVLQIIAAGGEVNASQNAVILENGGPSFRGWGKEAYIRALRKWLSGPKPMGNWEYIIDLSGQFSVLMPQDAVIISVVENRLIVSASDSPKVYRHFVWYNRPVAGVFICKRGELSLWEVTK